ncbi:pyruvate kinase, cytosolic isozyme [Artemisia annua]|uniref:Pyruvate kinase, cytosolic isozyme n=1 Tax=Artemisia annua TaxID=35608 RepID=A0A2U1PHH9_ARTAN|nr:pyruvate kinase, cytosolic isozyme [Artemisia annua]
MFWLAQTESCLVEKPQLGPIQNLLFVPWPRFAWKLKTPDYNDVFKMITANAPVPVSPLEILASSAIRTAISSKSSLILVLTRGGSTLKLVAKYRFGMPILSGVVSEIKIDSFDWSCSDESPARPSKEAIEFALQQCKEKGLCKTGDVIVALHHVGTTSIIKIVTVK